MTTPDWLADPVQATEARLALIAASNRRIRAFVTVDEAGARQAARRAADRRQSGRAMSPIDGMPVGIKANIAVAGLPFHAGIFAYRDRIATRDAACVARLKAGGAVILGLLNMDEAAFGDATDNPHFGRTENPWRPGFSAGGSSGGAAAAVAAGYCDAALGTDTLGSVRIPAAYCGVVGHKPAHGVISVDGVVPLAPNFDSLGILARSVATATHVLDWLAGAPSATGSNPPGLVGLLPPDWVEVAPAAAAALAAAADLAERGGLRVQCLKPLDGGFAELLKAAVLIVALAAAEVHRAGRARDPAGFSPGFLGMLDWALAQPSGRQAAARRRLADGAAEIRQVLATCSAILLPATPQPAFAWQARRPRNAAAFTVLANIAGVAATAFPAGLDEDGLPVSVQVIGPGDSACLSLAGRLAVELRPPGDVNPPRARLSR